MNLDDMLKSSKLGQRIHDDKWLGRFTGIGGPWQFSAKVDLPFQNDVSITFELQQDAPKVPKSMPKNIIWIQDNLGEIWNAAAAKINTFIEAEGITTPERFVLRSLWAFLPDAPLDKSEWRLEIAVEDMAVSFEVGFHGLDTTECNAA
jgi:hypothetical protein